MFFFSGMQIAIFIVKHKGESPHLSGPKVKADVGLKFYTDSSI